MEVALQFELVSPEKLLVSKAVAMVTVPGGEGEYGVLPGHAPMITTLQPGVIDVYNDDTSTVSERIFVSGGFAEVTAERCTVLAEGATPVAELDKVKIEEHIERLLESLPHNGHPDDEHVTAIEKQLAIARAQMQALAMATN